MKSLTWTTLVAGTVLGIATVAGSPTDTLDQLAGLSIRQGEAALERLDYRFIQAYKRDGKIHATWWNDEQARCLTVASVDGRYQSVSESAATACNHAPPPPEPKPEKAAPHPHPHNFQDLAGESGSAVEPRLQGNGFHVVDSAREGDTVSHWWFSPKTAECVKISIAAGRVSEVSRAPGYPACKVNR